MTHSQPRLAFCLFKFFPYGGLQRKMLNIARVCAGRGYLIDVYTRSWEGEVPDFVVVHPVESTGWSNHAKNESFSRRVQPLLQAGDYDAVVGFNRMPGLDVYYAADACYLERIQCTKSFLYRLTPRFRHFAAFERQVFDPRRQTRIMVLSAAEKQRFIHWYATPEHRFTILPPGISRDRMAPSDANEIRSLWRQEFGFDDTRRVILMVGSNFRGKGLGRLLRAVASLPHDLRSTVHLIVIGRDHPDPFERLAGRLGLADQLSIYTGRDDVPRFYLGADLFVHAADIGETAGNVILEAIVSGLPALVTESCGYAEHVRHADAGLLIPVPVVAEEFSRLLGQMLTSAQRGDWSRNGIEYGRATDLYSLPLAAADVIDEAVASHNRSPSGDRD